MGHVLQLESRFLVFRMIFRFLLSHFFDLFVVLISVYTVLTTLLVWSPIIFDTNFTILKITVLYPLFLFTCYIRISTFKILP